MPGNGNRPGGGSGLGIGARAAAAFLTVSCFAMAAEEVRPVASDPRLPAADSSLVRRGAVLGDGPSVALSEVLEDPEKFAHEPVIIEGAVTEVCQAKGCWMKVVPDSSETGVRVTFKDYGFFVPTTSQDWLVRAEGVFHIKIWTRDEADHLEREGARLTRNADGTATEIGFIASGVELRRKAAPPGAEEDSP